MTLPTAWQIVIVGSLNAFATPNGISAGPAARMSSLRVPVPGEAPTETELTAWPPPGEVWVCRRTGHDGFTWMPLFCAEPDSTRQRQPWDVREAAQAASPAGPVSFPG